MPDHRQQQTEAHIRAVCVFCGSRFGANTRFKKTAARLGQLLAENNIRLIYGGGHVGLMGTIADNVLENGGKVTGIIPEFLESLEVGHDGLSEKIETDSMHSRKRRMFEMSDAFLTMPGGLGTLDETFEIITWKQLRLHNKPVIILDDNGYWQPFQKLITSTIENGFADESAARLYTTVNSADEAISVLKSGTPQHPGQGPGTAKPERF